MFEKTIKKNQLNEEFTSAVLAGDIEKVRTLFAPLEELEDLSEDLSDSERERIEASIEEKIPYLDYEMVTTTGIMRAAQNEDWKMVAELFNLGANLEVKIDPSNWYLVHECVVNAPDNILHPILEYSNLNVKNKKGQTPLMVAIERNRDHAAQYILEKGVFNISEVDKEMNNVAHYAAKYNKQELLLKLIERGVPLLNTNKSGKTPVDLIEDDVFRMSIPLELERLSAEGKNVVLKDSVEAKADEKSGLSIDEAISLDSNLDSHLDKEEFSIKDKPKVSGLSKIKKK